MKTLCKKLLLQIMYIIQLHEKCTILNLHFFLCLLSCNFKGLKTDRSSRSLIYEVLPSIRTLSHSFTPLVPHPCILPFYKVRSQNCEKRQLALSFLSICPSVCMEQLGSNWTDFNEILYLSIFGKYVETVQVSLKSDNNNGYFA